MSIHLISYTKELLNKYISIREGETKVGEVISFGEDYTSKNIKFVFIGIPEDIGVIANNGKEGAKNGWHAFLGSFLNIQNNKFIDVESLHILGEVQTNDLYTELLPSFSTKDCKKTVNEIDKRVYEIILKIKKAGKTPIVIGGGHNNCYPIIKAISTTLKKPINILNIDPHADLRKKEGRHSGNGFTYAMEENFIKKYFVLGLHQEYNSNYIINKMNSSNSIDYLTYNKYLKEKLSIEKTVNYSSSFFKETTLGLELDLDSVAYMPVSAKTPSGFSLETIRKIILELSKNYKFEYIHICEGAPQNKEEEVIVGKTISYLCNDIIKPNINE